MRADVLLAYGYVWLRCWSVRHHSPAAYHNCRISDE